ncbi:MAG: DUF1573 domain-containing protein [Cyclobacteriaceae bacterium]|jgi:hypothetical protein|nr:DUF1573 domain-containing protein [Cyclobacteriaceae bacterium]
MKILNRVILVLLVGAAFASCKDRAAEKRIAELESRLVQLEGNGATPSSAVASPAATPVADTKPEGPLPSFEFATTDHDFGTIKEGDKVEYTYSFKNTGEAPLIIQNAQPSCGCTVPEWSKEPIPVGGTGYIKAEFDSNGKPNIQNKTITVTANTWPKVTTLRFKAMVTPKPTGANGPTR